MDTTLILTGLGSFAVGMFVGQILIWKVRTIRGYDVNLPTPHIRKPRWNKVVGIALVLVALVVVIQGVLFQNRQQDCNKDFLDALKYRSQITQEDNDLRDRNTALNSEDFAALSTFLGKLLTIPEDPPDDYLMPDLIEFNKTISDNQTEREDIIKEQERLDQVRADNPYPDTDCGS